MPNENDWCNRWNRSFDAKETDAVVRFRLILARFAYVLRPVVSGGHTKPDRRTAASFPGRRVSRHPNRRDEVVPTLTLEVAHVGGESGLVRSGNRGADRYGLGHGGRTQQNTKGPGNESEAKH